MVPSDDRAAVPVVGVVTLVGMTVVLAALIGSTAFAHADLTAPPLVVTNTDEPVTAATAGADDDQQVRIYHERGDSVPANEIEILVLLPDHDRETRLIDLPTEGELTTSGFDGDDIVDRRANRLTGPAFEGGEWSVGEPIGFRIKSYRDDGVALTPGDSVVVRVVHIPTGTMLVDTELPVR